MRVIAGKARSLQLKTIKDSSTRPTTDRIKETLFNMLQYQVSDSVFLDLFSGSGGIGIEALSRGAVQCVFVENNAKAASCIRENLQFTRLAEDGCLLEMDALSAIQRLQEKSLLFDIIFMDPPYGKGLEKQVLVMLKDATIADDHTLIIVEAALETDFTYVSELGMDICREKKYKTNKHVFIQKQNLLRHGGL